jgi:hypothetical protein
MNLIDQLASPRRAGSGTGLRVKRVGARCCFSAPGRVLLKQATSSVPSHAKEKQDEAEQDDDGSLVSLCKFSPPLPTLNPLNIKSCPLMKAMRRLAEAGLQSRTANSWARC